MLHKTVEAKATATEVGEFTAIAAAYSVDRGGERIVPGAFQNTIEKWQASGKQIPLHWDHGGEPDDIIGVVDPQLVKETDVGLMVGGRLDLENSERAKQVWRAMKDNSVALSFGYMVIDGGESEDEKTYDLRELDLFEVSVTPAPMNADTKFLSLKSVAHQLDEANLLRALDLGDAGELETWGDGEVIIRLADGTYKRGTYEAEGPEITFGKFKVVTKTVTYRAADETAVEDAEREEPPRAKRSAQDSLRTESLEAALDVLSDGASRRSYQEETPPAKPDPLDEADLLKRAQEFYLSL